tara:strand:- start:4402 stop:5103 length:702 start_codon:yes stop_codon:yes gene_type:complete
MSEALTRKYVKSGSVDNYIKDLVSKKLSFSIRKASECTEILMDDKHMVFASQTNFPKKKIYLFNNVKQQVTKWLNTNDVYLPENLSSIKYNYDYDTDEGTMCGTDLNHAYWRIAYLYGMINEKTYIGGLDTDCKALRLATLSVLGRQKKFDNYEKGEIKETYIYQKENVDLKNAFKFIRLTCWSIMKEVSELLGDDFYAWKTDCIYYRESLSNIKAVQDYFDKLDLTYKQLGY